MALKKYGIINWVSLGEQYKWHASNYPDSAISGEGHRQRKHIYSSTIPTAKTVVLSGMPVVTQNIKDYRNKWADLAITIPGLIVTARSRDILMEWFDFFNTVLIGNTFYCGIPVSAYKDDADSELALYHFENDALDSYTATSYDLTTSNVTFSTTSYFGSYSASFNGSTSYATQSTLLDTIPSAGGIAMFIKPASDIDSTLGSPQYLLYKQNTATEYMALYFDIDGKLKFQTYDATLETSHKTFWSWLQWYWILISWDSTHTALWVDGNCRKLGTMNYMPDNGTTGDLFIGAKDSTPKNPFSGVIDELRILSDTSAYVPPRAIKKIFVPQLNPVQNEAHLWAGNISYEITEFDVQVR